MFFLKTIILLVLLFNPIFCSAIDSTALAYPKSTLILDTTKAGDRILAVGEHGTILYSNDSAENWATTKSGVDILLTSIFFLNGKLGWATGHQGTILHSQDGGLSWNIQSYNINDDALFDILFKNKKQGIALGAYGLTLITENGGKSWQRKQITNKDRHLYSITTTQNGSYYIVGESGTILKSSDLKSWAELVSPYEGTLFTISSLKSNITAAGIRGNIIQSNDAGKSWEVLKSSTVAPFQSSTILSNGKILLGGSGGSLFIEDKSNNQFNRILFPINHGITNILPLSDSQLLFSGDFGLRKSPVNITLLTVNHD